MNKVFGMVHSLFCKTKSTKDDNKEICNDSSCGSMYKSVIKGAFEDESKEGLILKQAFNMACNCYNKEDYDSALEILLKMRQKLDNDVDIAATCFFVGRCYDEQGIFDKAIENYNKALQYRKNFQEAYNNAGAVCIETGDLVHAEQYLMSAIMCGNASEYEYVNIANVYLEMQEYDKAITYAQESLKLNDKLSLTYEILTIAYASLSNKEKASECYEYCIELGTDNKDMLKAIIEQEVA